MAQAKKPKSTTTLSKPVKTSRKVAKKTHAPIASSVRHRGGTKQALMIELLSRPEGATIADIVAATSWLPHTIRGAMARSAQKEAGAHDHVRKSRGSWACASR